MISTLSLMLATAAANRLWGWGSFFLPRAMAMILPATVATISHPVWGFTVLFGLILWRSYGTGEGFAAITGRWPEPPKRDPLRLYAISRAVIPVESPALFGIVWGTLRGAVMALPLFGALAWLHGLSALYWWPLAAAWGLVYWIAGIPGEKGAVERAEYAVGAVMGLAIGGAMGWIQIPGGN